MPHPWFTPRTLAFLVELAANNDREWFLANKSRYLADARDPALAFIADFARPLRRISPHFRADPRVSGGSLFRIYRDTRFSRDKSPYKTHIGIQFRHEAGRDAHAPGFYLHIEPGNCFAGAGVWRPAGPALRRIREGIDEDGPGWKRASRGRRFRESFELAGNSLVRAPRGFSMDHPLIEDLRRKDFIAVAPLTEDDIVSASLVEEFARLCAAAQPLQRWLCGALGVPW